MQFTFAPKSPEQIAAEMERERKWRLWDQQRKQNRRARREAVKRVWQEKNAQIPGRIALPDDFNQTGDGNCGVVATAIACRVSYTEVWNFFARNKRGSWKGSLAPFEMNSALRHFGCKVETTPYTKSHRVTVADLARVTRNEKTSYMVYVRGHVLILRSGYYIDQRGAIPIQNVPSGGGAIVESAYKILED